MVKIKYLLYMFLVAVSFTFITGSAYAVEIDGVVYETYNMKYFGVGGTSEYSIYEYEFSFNGTWFNNLKHLRQSIDAVYSITHVYALGAHDYGLNIVQFDGSGFSLGFVDYMIFTSTPTDSRLSFYYNNNLIAVLDNFDTNDYYLRTQDILTFNFDMYSRGVNEGYQMGYREGYDDGEAYGRSLHENDYQKGFEAGESAGYLNGYDKGFTDGFESTEDGGMWGVLWSAILAPFTILNIEMLPGVTLAMIVAVPLVFGLLGWILSTGKSRK